MAESPSRAIREVARPITGAQRDYGPLLDLAEGARFVLLGAATHGAHDFYRERDEITRLLILHRGFNAVAVDADWPDARRVDRYVRGEGEAGAPLEALAAFLRFPSWTWRNTVMLDFAAWLRAHNDAIADPTARCGFYGLDLYNLRAGMRAALDYLDRADPEAARRARYRYACFEDFAEDPHAEGYAAAFHLEPSRERELVAHLAELRRFAADAILRADALAAGDFFFEQNPRLVQNAEPYYSAMFGGRVPFWNLRETHLADTLDALTAHLDRQYGTARVVVWAHNAQVGDARATDMAEPGKLNLGQLVKHRHAGDAVLVGLTTYDGTVTAASEWDGPAEAQRLRPAPPSSWEDLFHHVGWPQFLLMTAETGDLGEEQRLERAIGAVYRPASERASHYFHARLKRQFDAVLHLDRTRAVEPLERLPSPAEPLETIA